MLERLAQEGVLKVTALAEPFDMSLAAASKHVHVLQRAGLLVQEKDGRVRRCRLAAEPMQAAADWMTQYRRFWEMRFGSLAEYLARTKGEDDALPADAPVAGAGANEANVPEGHIPS
jgi:hypothetical protein